MRLSSFELRDDFETSLVKVPYGDCGMAVTSVDDDGTPMISFKQTIRFDTLDLRTVYYGSIQFIHSWKLKNKHEKDSRSERNATSARK